jgi:hypothetical protein
MTYKLCLTVINKGTYGTKEEMCSKLDVFLLNNRVSQDEYNSLVSLLEEKSSQ